MGSPRSSQSQRLLFGVLALVLGGSATASGSEPPAARLSGQLREFLWARRDSQPSALQLSSRLRLPRADYRIVGEDLRVEIWADDAAAARGLGARWRAEGMQVEVIAGELIQLVASPSQLWRMAGEEGVRRVDFVTFPKAHEVTGEGVQMMGVGVAHAAGLDGRGVHILLIDSGFAGYADLLGTELPASVNTPRSEIDGFEVNGTDHGTACAEIAYDVAPGATMSLVTAGSTAEWVAVLQWAADQADIDIVTMSHGWDDIYPQDGSSLLSRSLTAIADRGKLVLKSAGNAGDELIRVPLVDADANGLADLGPDDDRLEIYIGRTANLDVDLRWDEPFGAAGLDLDLCVYDGDNNLIGCGGDKQNGNDNPTEGVYRTSTGASAVLYVEVRCDPVQGCPTGYTLRLTSEKWRDWRFPTIGADHDRRGTLTVPGDARRILTVGAVGYRKYYRTVTTYSSEGPTEDGRTKPEIFGPSHITTSLRSGGTGFTGTSAAAPHVAALGAVYWQQNPQWSAAQLRAAMIAGVDVNISGRLFGSGLAYFDVSSVDCNEACLSRCGEFRGCECGGCIEGRVCDQWNRCIDGQPEGGPCQLDTSINAAAGACREGLLCLGKTEGQGACEFSYECTASNYWRNFDCVAGNCYRSYCYKACESGTCPAGYDVEMADAGCYCEPDSWSCVPDCEGRVCGPDTCGLLCGDPLPETPDGCAVGNACNADGKCVCIADCQGRACGSDGCGGECGTCGPDEACSEEQQCECAPECSGRSCGQDPVCGSSCGDCALPEQCTDGQCICNSDCAGLSCGVDPVCGSPCGTCGVSEHCSAGACVAIEPPQASKGCGCRSHGRGAVPGWALTGLALVIWARRRHPFR